MCCFLFVRQVALHIVQGHSCLFCGSVCVCARAKEREKRGSHGEAAPWGPPAEPPDAGVAGGAVGTVVSCGLTGRVSAAARLRL